ncbi:MAG: DUF5110 domain-containing protein, partial [Candidatus Rokuibacteriota bacterium]
LIDNTPDAPTSRIPQGASRFELYEDDGRSNAYRRGLYALTPITCVAQAGGVDVRIGLATGDRSVVPGSRRYLLRLRLERPTAVTVEGAGELPHAGGDTGRPGWWVDGAGFLGIRPPEVVPLGVVVTRSG